MVFSHKSTNNLENDAYRIISILNNDQDFCFTYFVVVEITLRVRTSNEQIKYKSKKKYFEQQVLQVL